MRSKSEAAESSIPLKLGRLLDQRAGACNQCCAFRLIRDTQHIPTSRLATALRVTRKTIKSWRSALRLGIARCPGYPHCKETNSP